MIEPLPNKSPQPRQRREPVWDQFAAFDHYAS